MTENSTPVGSGRFRDLPKTGEESWAGLFPLPLLSIKWAAWHTRMGTKLGMKSRFLLSKATTGNKLDEHPTYKRTLFLLLIHSHFLPFEERMSQVASTGFGSGEGGTARRGAGVDAACLSF